jgi:hypothetical protein
MLEEEAAAIRRQGLLRLFGQYRKFVSGTLESTNVSKVPDFLYVSWSVPPRVRPAVSSTLEAYRAMPVLKASTAKTLRDAASKSYSNDVLVSVDLSISSDAPVMVNIDFRKSTEAKNWPADVIVEREIQFFSNVEKAEPSLLGHIAVQYAFENEND